MAWGTQHTSGEPWKSQEPCLGTATNADNIIARVKIRINSAAMVMACDRIRTTPTGHTTCIAPPITFHGLRIVIRAIQVRSQWGQVFTHTTCLSSIQSSNSKPQVQQYSLQQQQVVAPPQSRLSSIVSIDSLASSDTVPFIFPTDQTLYNIFTDPYFLDDLDPPGVDPENWYEESMRFIEESGRYQRPETSIEAGTGWMADIQWPDSDGVETPLVGGLREFNGWQEAAEDYEWNLGDVENDFGQGECIALQNENSGYQEGAVVEEAEGQD